MRERVRALKTATRHTRAPALVAHFKALNGHYS